MISDFGLSKMEDSGIMATACGTPGYVGEASIPPIRDDCLDARIIFSSRGTGTETLRQSRRRMEYRCDILHTFMRLSAILRRN